jgi:hypothetical protein
MTGRNWLLLGALATLFGNSGCIMPGYEGAKLAREAGPSCEVPISERNQLYVFVVGGNNPLEMLALDKFRTGLNSQGFAKVASGPSPYAIWMIWEMRRIHAEDPNAVFVIAGLESCAPTAVKLSEKALQEGLPVEGVAIIDSSGKTSNPAGNLRTLIVTTGYGIRVNAGVEALVVTAPGPLGLAADSRTIDRVVMLLKEVALANPAPPPPPSDTELVYYYARTVPFSRDIRENSEWSFLFDRPGGQTPAINEPLPTRPVPPAINANTAAK